MLPDLKEERWAYAGTEVFKVRRPEKKQNADTCTLRHNALPAFWQPTPANELPHTLPRQCLQETGDSAHVWEWDLTEGTDSRMK